MGGGVLVLYLLTTWPHFIFPSAQYTEAPTCRLANPQLYIALLVGDLRKSRCNALSSPVLWSRTNLEPAPAIRPASAFLRS